MSIVNKVKIKNSDGTYTTADIGASAANIQMSDGNSLQTDYNTVTNTCSTLMAGKAPISSIAPVINKNLGESYTSKINAGTEFYLKDNVLRKAAVDIPAGTNITSTNAPAANSVTSQISNLNDTTMQILNDLSDVSTSYYVGFPAYSAEPYQEMNYPNLSYTAIANCWLIGYSASLDGTTASVSVNNISIGGATVEGQTAYICIPVKAGSVIATRDVDASKVMYRLKVYRCLR